MLRATLHRFQCRLPRPVGNRVVSGQALVIGALMMTALVAMSGLTIDVGVWMVAKARLQRGVDTAALSIILDRPAAANVGGTAATASVKSRTIIVDQAVPDTQIQSITTAIPRTNQLSVEASQRVPTAFARVIGVEFADITARATADINSYINIPVSPICGALDDVGVVCDGGVGDSTMDAFGVNRDWGFGDAYSNDDSPWYNDAVTGDPVFPNGYVYRIHVDPGYTGDLVIQGWDVDGFNKRNPPVWDDPCGPGGTPGVNCQMNANPYRPELNDLNESYPSVGRDYWADGYHLFWRIDECNVGGQTCRVDGEMTPLGFTLWSLNAGAPDPLNPLPSERTDLDFESFGPTSGACSGGGFGNCTRVYTCTSDANGNVSNSTCPDMKWVELFRLSAAQLAAVPMQVDGSRSLFIDVKSLGSTNSENAYHLRSGPPPGDADQESCQESGVWSDGRSNWEDVNNQVNCQWSSNRGSAYTKVYALRSMPVNVVQAGGTVPYIVWLGYVPKSAAGQSLRLRNYDLDASACPPLGSLNEVTYKAYFPSDGRHVDLLDTCGSRGTAWAEDTWQAPLVSDAFWGSDDGFWLYIDVFQKPGVFWDTAVFEVIHVRARLVL